MWSRVELKDKAKFNVKSFYWKSVLVAFLLSLATGGGGSSNGRNNNQSDGNIIKNYFLNGFATRWIALVLGLAVIAIIGIAIAGIAIDMFLLNPLEVSCKKYFLDGSNGNAELSNLSYAFKNNYANQVATMFLRNLFIFLWSLLLIIPGIVKAYEYRMIPYLLAENPNLSFSEAKSISSQMMEGEKWNAFVLDLSFIGWNILSGITFGVVGAFWVGPYKAYTDAELYKALAMKPSEPNNFGYNTNSQF